MRWVRRSLHRAGPTAAMSSGGGRADGGGCCRTAAVMVRIIRWETPGLVVQGRWRRRFTIAYREILTAERLSQPWRGIRLHTTTTESIRIRCRSRERERVENELRR